MDALKVKSREGMTKSQIKSLRQSGQVPMAIVGKGQDTRMVQADMRELANVLHATHAAPVFPVLVEGASKSIQVVVKQIDRHIVTHQIINLSVQEVRSDDTITVGITIDFVGEPRSVTLGESVLLKQMDKLEVKGQVDRLPEALQIDVSSLGPNDKIVVGDIPLPEGVVATHPEDTAVVITTPSTVSASVAQDEEAAAAGEVEPTEPALVGESDESEEE